MQVHRHFQVCDRILPKQHPMSPLDVQALHRKHVCRALQFLCREKQRRRLLHLVYPPVHDRRQQLQFVYIDCHQRAEHVQVRGARLVGPARRGPVQNNRLQVFPCCFLQSTHQFAEFSFHRCDLSPGVRSSPTSSRQLPLHHSTRRQTLRIRRDGRKTQRTGESTEGSSREKPGV